MRGSRATVAVALIPRQRAEITVAGPGRVRPLQARCRRQTTSLSSSYHRRQIPGVPADARRELPDAVGWLPDISGPDMLLRIRSITYLATRINGYELVDPSGQELPSFTAGAHISVQLSTELVRDFSLWNDPSERTRYCIAVLREGAGSQLLHEGVRVGNLVAVSIPRNNFPLVAEAERHLMIAGGIGITPIIAMIAELRRRRAEFQVHYCTRSPEDTAFLDDLAMLAAKGRVRFHHDGGDPANGLDIAAALRECRPGTHLYYCGPAGMMAAAAAASAHWPAGTVHFEFFAGPAAVAPMTPESSGGQARSDF